MAIYVINYGENEESHKDFGIAPKIDTNTGKTENANAIAVVKIVNTCLFSCIMIKKSTKAVTEKACNNYIANSASISYAAKGKTPAKCKLIAKINDDIRLSVTPNKNKQNQKIRSGTFIRFNNQQ